MTFCGTFVLAWKGVIAWLMTTLAGYITGVEVALGSSHGSVAVVPL